MIALCGCAFQSTRPSRGATNFTRPLFGRSYISIHAPLAGRDLGVTVTAYPQSVFQSTRPSRGATWRFPMRGGGTRHFNPRAPRGARPISFKGGEEYILFQSTRPSRGATQCRLHAGCRRKDFNPRAPRGARLCRHLEIVREHVISIHAPLAGRDSKCAQKSRTYLR